MNRPIELDGCSRKYVAGVYQIKNVLTGKFYIGSSNHLYRRYSDHLRELRRGTHSNPKLQNSWNKFGKGNFEFSILEFCFPEQVYELEQRYINELNPFFNISKEVGIPNTPKAGTYEAKLRSEKNLESRKQSSWINSKKFHDMLSEIMYERWKNIDYKNSRSKNTKSLWENIEYRIKQKISHSKLSPEQKAEIINLKKSGYKSGYLEKAFGVSSATISRICRGLQ